MQNTEVQGWSVYTVKQGPEGWISESNHGTAKFLLDQGQTTHGQGWLPNPNQ